MSTDAYIIGDSSARLWTLTSRERLSRQIKQVPALRLIEYEQDMAPGRALLVLHADYLFEPRTLEALTECPNSLLLCPADGAVAAAMIQGDQFAGYQPLIGDALPSDFTGPFVLTPKNLAAFDPRLRRSESPLLESLRSGSVDALEAQLYGNSYKGITDLVTKWLWPRPAKRVVAWCARRQLTPNMVTMTGFVLMIAAGFLFNNGQYALGLLAGWIMTFLDTVDGKLARVTVQSSRVGHIADHGMDLLHPPFWYVIWGLSLAEFTGPWGLAVGALAWWIVGGYTVGRISEGLFHLLGSCGLFTWRPFDAYFRLITARRNPCMILLTVSIGLGRPDWGYVAVAAWTMLTSCVLVLRLLQGVVARTRTGPLHSWLTEPGVADGPNAKAYRVFSGTRSAYDE